MDEKPQTYIPNKKLIYVGENAVQVPAIIVEVNKMSMVFFLPILQKSCKISFLSGMDQMIWFFNPDKLSEIYQKFDANL